MVSSVSPIMTHFYETPESFSSAFTRFHGVSPMAARSQTSQTVAFMRVDNLDSLHSFVKKNGWEQITEVETQSWGGQECSVTTIDGSVIRFFELN